MPPRTLPGSMERHREVCRKNLPEQSTSSSNSSMEGQDEVDRINGSFERHQQDAHMIATVTGMRSAADDDTMQPPYSSQLLQQQELLSRSPPAGAIIVNSSRDKTSCGGEGVGGRPSINTNTRSAKRIGVASNGRLSVGEDKKSNNYKATGKQFPSLSPGEGSEDFSDDSLEDTSLPPHPPPPTVPPPPSLSCPVTPNKRGSIAWEINLDDPMDTGHRTGVNGEVDRVNGGATATTGKVTDCFIFILGKRFN